MNILLFIYSFFCFIVNKNKCNIKYYIKLYYVYNINKKYFIFIILYIAFTIKSSKYFFNIIIYN